MRIALALACGVGLGGCLIEPVDDGYDYGSSATGAGWGSGWGGGGGGYQLGCYTDSECGGGYACTRTGECLPSAEVRAVRTVWTVRGEIATEASCARASDLSITFLSSAGEQFGYTPVPCQAGKFTVDKFPRRFTGVQLARDQDYDGGDSGVFDAEGTAALDLPY